MLVLLLPLLPLTVLVRLMLVSLTLLLLMMMIMMVLIVSVARTVFGDRGKGNGPGHGPRAPREEHRLTEAPQFPA